MDKAKRIDLLRQRFKKVAGSFAFKSPTKKKPKRYEPRRTEFRFVYPMGFSGGPGFVGKWVVRPDEKPGSTVSTKHRKGVPAVTMIAAKAPKKLTRVYRDADALLAERKRRLLL